MLGLFGWGFSFFVEGVRIKVRGSGQPRGPIFLTKNCQGRYRNNMRNHRGFYAKGSRIVRQGFSSGTLGAMKICRHAEVVTDAYMSYSLNSLYPP